MNQVLYYHVLDSKNPFFFHHGKLLLNAAY